MTQSPQSGQAAPRSTDFAPSGSNGVSESNGAAAGSAGYGSPAGWSSTSYGQAPATADSPTGSLPSVSREGQHTPPSQVAGTVDEPGRSRPGRTSRNRGPRRARLQLRHIDPWTVLKFSCVLSIALFFVWLIVVGVLFGILDTAGIIGKINDTVTTIQGGNAKAPVTAGIVFGGAAVIGVVNIVLFIALSTIGSLVYNLCADLVGGVEITLSER